MLHNYDKFLLICTLSCLCATGNFVKTSLLFTGSQRKERKGSISMSKPATTKRSRADSSDNTVNSTSGSPNPAKVGNSTTIMINGELKQFFVIISLLKHFVVKNWWGNFLKMGKFFLSQ